MKEFKGTKGEWIVQWNGHFNEVLSTSNNYVNGGTSTRIMTHVHSIDEDGKVINLSGEEEDKANAALIALAGNLAQKYPDVEDWEKKLEGWISVEDRLPDEDTKVLVWLHNFDNPHWDCENTGAFLNGKFYLKNGYNTETEKVTHWMTLPSPPSTNTKTE